MPLHFNLPVRTLAEFIARSGSIDSRRAGGGADRGAKGTRAHRRLQKQGGPGYTPEQSLWLEICQGDFVYRLTGRADGVIRAGGEDGGVTVDEIKTVTALPAAGQENRWPAHWVQGRCYAYILCVQENLDACGVQITYCDITTGEVRRILRRYPRQALESEVLSLLAQVEKWAKLALHWQEKRTQSLRALTFPFGGYRGGQREMAVGVYNTIQTEDRLFCAAPTGIGKTASALFPALKAMGEGLCERVFYLTAKTPTRRAAEDTLALMGAGQGLHFRFLTLTAKGKLCFLDKRACNPQACPYADGYYDRVNDAVYALLQTQTCFTREAIEAAAQAHRLCPYELALDISLWCDGIICDYNYLFDPTVRLQRFFGDGRGTEGLLSLVKPAARDGGDATGRNMVFLIDEAHNLVERGREMYSAAVRKSDYYAVKKALPKTQKRLHKALSALNSAFVALRKQCEEESAHTLELPGPPDCLAAPIDAFTRAAEAFLEEGHGYEAEDDLLTLYFNALFYQSICEAYGPHYTTMLTREQSEVTIKLFCIDPSPLLDDCMGFGRASVLFSATLHPLGYYRRTLGGQGRFLSLESPFPPQNLGLFVANGIDTRYTGRQRSLADVAALLARMAEGRAGNYIAFFPSYSYLRQTLEVFRLRAPHIPVLEQAPGMDDAAREAFLARFAPDTTETLLAFCVMGGIFGEGVDLPGSRLIGTAIVGVGLPQIGPQPDAIRRYYDEISDDGFAFAYQYPGMNKVMQAAGRVIRTEHDRGVVLLLDSRFATPRYQELFPPHWRHWRAINTTSAASLLEGFWEG